MASFFFFNGIVTHRHCNTVTEVTAVQELDVLYYFLEQSGLPGTKHHWVLFISHNRLFSILTKQWLAVKDRMK